MPRLLVTVTPTRGRPQTAELPLPDALEVVAWWARHPYVTVRTELR